MQNKETLYEQLNNLKNLIPIKQWNYYNLLSIENFIYHIDNIKNERAKTKVYEEIENYIALVRRKVPQEAIKKETSRELDKYVYKISEPYKLDVGFVVRPYYPVIIIFLIVFFILLRAYFNFLNAAIITLLVVGITFFYYSIKTRQKKVY